MPPLTQQYDDADEDGDNGARAQAGGGHGPGGAAVSVVVTGADLDPDHGAVGQRRVPRVGHDDGDLVHAGLQVGDPQPQLGEVACGLRGQEGGVERHRKRHR